MTSELLVRYLHFLALLAMISLITIEHLLLKSSLRPSDIKRLLRVDGAYGLSALVALLTGAGLWLWVGKPPGFYSGNWVFHSKIVLFVLLGLVSFIPTGFLLKARKTAEEDVSVPARVVWALRCGILLICAIPLLAVMMANGVGYIR